MSGLPSVVEVWWATPPRRVVFFSADFLRDVERTPGGVEDEIIRQAAIDLPAVLVIPNCIQHADDFLARAFKVGRTLTELYAEYDATGYQVEALP